MSVAAVVIVAVVVTVAVVIVVVVERTGTLPVSRHSALPSCPVRYNDLPCRIQMTNEYAQRSGRLQPQRYP